MNSQLLQHSPHQIKSELLDVLPSSCNNQRLTVIRERNSDGSEQMVLQQESYAKDVGWYLQSCVSITTEQLCGLKLLLTGRAASMTVQRKSLTAAQGQPEMLPEDDEHILVFPKAS